MAMTRQESKDKIDSYETQINSANSVSSLEKIIGQSSQDLLGSLSGFHITQRYCDQLSTIANTLDTKKGVLSDQKKQLEDENKVLNVDDIKLDKDISDLISEFNTDLKQLKNMSIVSSSLPSGGYTSSLLQLNAYKEEDYFSNKAQYDSLYTNQKGFEAACTKAQRRHRALDKILESINEKNDKKKSNGQKKIDNKKTIGDTPKNINNIDKKIKETQDITALTNEFVGLNDDDCGGGLTGETYETFDDLLLPGVIGAKFGFRDAFGKALTVVSSIPGITDAYSIQIKQSDGKKLTRLIQKDDLTIDENTGVVSFKKTAKIYDPSGKVYIPPEGKVTFDVYPTVTKTINGLSVYNSKKLVVDRLLSLIDRDDILTNANDPAFTAQLHQRLFLDYSLQIKNSDRPDSQISKSVRGFLDQHPEYAKLSDHQKTELYQQILDVPYGAILPKMLLRDAIGATQAMDPKTGNSLPHHDLFATYVQSKDVEPKPSADDLSDETKYRNRLSRNLSTLTVNYFGNLIKKYLADPVLVQTINNKVIDYTTAFEQNIINSEMNLVPNINLAVTRLRGCLPQSKNNRSWTTLMMGRSAQIKDTVTHHKDTFSYTSDVVFSNAPSVSATLQLNDAAPIVLHGRTPGDLLAKILTGGGARIDGQRERLHMAFGTMKAIIKANPAYAAGLSVPINQTNGSELRIALDSNDNIKVARYNFDAPTNTFIESTVVGDVFDESNPHDKERLTHNFIVNLNSVMNRVMDNQYTGYQDTMRSAKNPLRKFSNWVGLSREEMSYKAKPRLLRGMITKWINRKQPGVETFSFPVTVGNTTMNVDYNPDGTITIEANGKTRKGKSLAKLLNPTSMTMFGGIFANKKNFTDGFEIPIMQGLYDGLSRQLMQNERVNQYTYMVRDPQTQIVYTLHADGSGEPQIGVIENVTGSPTRTRNMLMFDRQKSGRTKGIPPQGIRQLNEGEKQAILGRPDIMDGFTQNMLKAREELVHVPVGGYRGLSLNALGLGKGLSAGIGASVLGGIDLSSGGLFSSSLYTADAATNTFVTGSGPATMWSVTKSAANSIGNVLSAGTKVIASPVKGTLGMAA